MNVDPARALERVSVRMHNVGFGDCFLVSFAYAQPLEDGRKERHMLIDFGTMSSPAQVKPLQVAEAIRDRTAGRIDVVVVTHRHRDHLSAFGTAEIATVLTESGTPELVVRSWTEDPDADAGFTGAGARPAERSLAFVRSLRDAARFATEISRNVTARSGRGLTAELRRSAETQLANAAAVDQLATWAGGSGEYLSYGMETRIEEVVPGVSVRVLGPPTIEQHPEVAGQRKSDQEEFWMLYRRFAESIPDEVFAGLASRPADDAPEREGFPDDPIIGPTRWIVDRLNRQELSSLLRIVRIMDDQLNNTSLILLFTIEGAGGTKRMLFGGDAQIENWEYALKHADAEENRDLLRGIDLYKVGHHGSRNATPKTLYRLWTEPGSIDRPIAFLMSTKSGLHGDHPETAVPRETLVSALRGRARGAFFSSEAIEGTWVEMATDFASTTGFVESAHG